MRTTIMKGAMSVALLTAVSCSQTETDIFPAGGGDAGTTTALGVTASMKMGNETRAVVDYKKITYPIANYADAWCAPGLGVVLTNAAGTNWYNDDLSVYGGNHIWFMGDASGENWISKKGAKGAAYDENKVDYNLSVEVGQVYAYYPYDASISSTTPAGGTKLPQGGTGHDFSVTDLKIPVAVKATGTIDATNSNADRVWNPTGSTWDEKDVTDGNYIVTLADLTEKDYLYFDGTGGRFVNNGHAGNATSANDNTNTTNPGYGIDLKMQHALSMVSFRVYDGGNLGDAGKVKLTKFKIADNGGQFVNTTTGTMQIADGTLALGTATGNMTIERTVDNYTLVQQIPSGTETEHTFIEQGGVTGGSVSKIVSAIVYPTDFSAGGSLKLTVTLEDSTSGTAKEADYSVNIPARNWEKNKNYLYTLSAGRNKLNIVSVEVQEWTVVNAGELPL